MATPGIRPVFVGAGERFLSPSDIFMRMRAQKALRETACATFSVSLCSHGWNLSRCVYGGVDGGLAGLTGVLR